MAANNYFGFTHGTTQYAAAAYQAPQAGYAVAPAAAAAAATYTTQRAATGYDYQQTAHAAPATYAVAASSGTPAATYDYSGYARAAPGAATYDATKTYYQQPAPAPAQPQTYASTDYQAVARAAGHKAAAPAAAGYPTAGYTATAQAPAQATYTYTAPAAQTTGASFNGASVSYTTATPNYPTTYPSQNHTPTNTVAKAKTGGNSTWQGYKKAGGVKQMRPKTQPKPQQLHYCEVCKISCAGPQTYREHLEGQRHKKKEALQKEGGTAATVNPRGSNNLRCELCDVVCTGSDAYAAHLRGAKHQKVVKLHTKLGKPIPEVDMKTAKAAAAGSIGSATGSANSKISFIQSGTLGTVKVEKDDGLKEDQNAGSIGDIEMLTSSENEITPVGQEYIEEIKNEEGKLISFNCKLCECKFNDPNAKDMHMKGRRHRLQFKKKVNPDLVVDVKPSGRRGRMQEEKMKRRDDFIRRRDDDRFWTDRLGGDERMYWEDRRRFEEEMEYMEWMRRRGGGGGAPPTHPAAFMQPIPFGLRRPETIDDRHFMAKHQQILPKAERMQVLHKFTSQIENTLKVVCKQVSQQHNKPDAKKDGSKDEEKKDDKEDGKQDKSGSNDEPLIRGVVRVGNLPKNLMLVDDCKVNLVIMASEFPTKSLLTQICNLFQSQVKISDPDETYTTTLCIPEGCFIVSCAADTKLQAIVSLTSPIVRDMLLQDGEVASGRGAKQEALIDETKCLEALAQLRRTKWFQARPANNPSSVMVIRILRDLCHRNPTWTPLGEWTRELLVDRVVGCAAFSGSEALRKVLEAIAGGVLLPGGPGIADPCEREPTAADAALSLTAQQRTDITASAQHALRLFAFRQIHKVLGIAQLVHQPRHQGNRVPIQRFNRKRRRDHSAGENQDSEAGDGKKDKKDSDDVIESSAK